MLGGRCVEFPGEKDPTGCVHGTEIAGDTKSPVESLVASIALSSPDAPAIQCGNRVVTYGELISAADAVANTMLARGIARGSRIATLFDQGPEAIIGVLAILRHGGTYVPLDSSYSAKRVETIVERTRIDWIATDVNGVAQIEAVGRNLLEIDSIIRDVASLSPDTKISAKPGRSAPAYLVFTSGSSGEPKAVVVGRGSLSRMTAARRMVYPGAGRWLLVSPLAFDSSAAVIWGALTSGGCLVIPPPGALKDPGKVAACLGEQQVTHLLCVPSLYRLLLKEILRAPQLGTGWLECVILAGEAVPDDVVNNHFASTVAAASLVNEYGPSETTIWASYALLEQGQPVLIGDPAPGVKLRVVDEAGRDPADEGELLIGGAGVSEGYLNDPARNAAAFVSLNGDSTTTFYRTGDRVRWHGNRLEFLGRFDQQVKIRGQRVDLLQIEAHLRNRHGIEEVCALQSPGDGDLELFLAEGDEPDQAEIRADLRQTFGDAHVPSRIALLEKLPRTVSGKIDRPALQARSGNAAARPASNQKAAAPIVCDAIGEADALQLVTSAWSEVLDCAEVPQDINFFDLGGHSLIVFRLQDAIEKVSGQRVPVVELFRRSTVREQAAWLLSNSASQREPATGLAVMPGGQDMAGIGVGSFLEGRTDG